MTNLCIETTCHACAKLLPFRKYKRQGWNFEVQILDGALNKTKQQHEVQPRKSMEWK